MNVLRFNIEYGKDSLVVYDTACIYDSCSNETGYGAPNFAASAATSATLTITIPGVVTPVIVNVYPTLPNETGVGFEITYASLGILDAPVGEWDFEYTVTFPGSKLTKSCMFLNTCAVDCCLAERIKKIDVKCGGIYDKLTNRMVLMMEGALANHACCLYDQADEIIKEVYTLCTGSDCEATCGCEC